MIEILVAVALIWLLVKAIGWLLAFIVALLSKFFAISINVIKIFFLGLIGIALGIGVIIGIINYIKAFVSRINPYEYYVDYSRKKQQYAKRKSYFFGPGFAQLTYSCISKYENGEVKIIADEEGGSDLLASAVFVKDDGNELIIGEGAKEEGVLAPERLFQFFKRWIGKDPETEPDYKHYIVDGKEYTPVELSSLVLKRIKEYAKKAGEEVEDVIITCPAYFDFAQRELTKKAGELAGLNVLAVINEPMAVAISYSNEEYLKSQNVLVYDLGGGTFDVLLKIFHVKLHMHREMVYMSHFTIQNRTILK